VIVSGRSPSESPGQRRARQSGHTEEAPCANAPRPITPAPPGLLSSRELGQLLLPAGRCRAWLPERRLVAIRREALDRRANLIGSAEGDPQLARMRSRCRGMSFPAPTGPHRTGPSPRRHFGRKAGILTGFDRYSPASGLGRDWLAGPPLEPGCATRRAHPENWMTFCGRCCDSQTPFRPDRVLSLHLTNGNGATAMAVPRPTPTPHGPEAPEPPAGRPRVAVPRFVLCHDGRRKDTCILGPEPSLGKRFQAIGHASEAVTLPARACSGSTAPW